MHSYQRRSLPKSRTKKRRSPDTAPQESTLPNISRLVNAPTPENVLALQRLVGNAATRQLLQTNRAQSSMLIQRMPTSAVIQGVTGTAKKDKRIGGKVIKKESTRFKTLLDTFDAYDRFLDTYAAPVTLQTLKDYFATLKTEVQGYIGSKKSGFKYAYFKNLLTQIDTERDLALKRYDAHFGGKTRPPTIKWRQLTWASPTLTITDADVTGSDKGGTNSVEKTTLGGKAAFYKGNTNVVPNLSVMDARGYGHTKGTALEGMSQGGVQNSYRVPAHAGMFDESRIKQAGSWEEAGKIADAGGAVVDVNLRLANRDVATARLGAMLNSEVIAHAELAYRKKGNNLEYGSIMEAAKGKQQHDLQFVDQASGGAQDTVGLNDPNLQRLLSRLQLIDALSGQVDRNLSNFFIRTDGNGNVTQLTGIDNDMSFGARRLAFDSRFNFPGISQFVDAELARRIIALKPADLELALMDLLERDELDALTTRLGKLQTFLLDLQRRQKLLEPNQWNKATAQGMFQEDSSYYAALRKLRNDG